jgi:hypothetical protein
MNIIISKWKYQNIQQDKIKNVEEKRMLYPQFCVGTLVKIMTQFSKTCSVLLCNMSLREKTQK